MAKQEIVKHKLKTPYSFVPLSEWVYIPSWSYNVSHDIPFEDGLDGEITFELKNVSSLCVGSYQKELDDKQKVLYWEKNENGEFVIPGSSIKGMLRNVFEISTFSKFRLYDKDHHSRRVIKSDNPYMDYHKELRNNEKDWNNPIPGWLKYENEEWKFYPCVEDHFAKVYYPDLFECIDPNGDLKSRLETFCSKKEKTSKYKYETFSTVLKENHLITSEEKNKLINYKIYYSTNRKQGSNDKATDTWCYVAKNLSTETGDKSGYIVFTGARVGEEKYIAESLRNNGQKISKDVARAQARRYCFVFGEPQKTCECLSSEVYKNFINSQFKAEKKGDKRTDPYLVNKYMKKEMNHDFGMPVFAFCDSNKKIVQVATCRMPQMMTKYTIEDLVVNSQKAQQLYNGNYAFDMSEVVFGTLRENTIGHMSMKSRLAFSDLVAQSSSQTKIVKDLVLMNPRTSFEGGYLEGGYDEENSIDKLSYSAINNGKPKYTIAGWKRYNTLKGEYSPSVVNEFVRKNSDKHEEVSANVKSACEMITCNNGKGATFKNGKIVFHNLRPVELGALLWVMKFGNVSEKPGDNDNNYSYHSLGHAKPYGAGKVYLDNIKLSFSEFTKDFKKDQVKTKEVFISDFVSFMNKQYASAFNVEKVLAPNAWEKSPQISNLRRFAMAHDLESNSQIYNFTSQFNSLANKEKPLYLRKERARFVSDGKVDVLNSLNGEFMLNSITDNKDDNYIELWEKLSKMDSRLQDIVESKKAEKEKFEAKEKERQEEIEKAEKAKREQQKKLEIEKQNAEAQALSKQYQAEKESQRQGNADKVTPIIGRYEELYPEHYKLAAYGYLNIKPDAKQNVNYKGEISLPYEGLDSLMYTPFYKKEMDKTFNELLKAETDAIYNIKNGNSVTEAETTKIKLLSTFYLLYKSILEKTNKGKKDDYKRLIEAYKSLI